MKPRKRRITDLILEAVPESIAWKDLNFVYQGCNEKFAKVAGYDTSEEIIGKTDHDLSWKDYADSYLVTDKQVMNSGQPVFKMVEFIHHKDSDDIWVEITLLPLFDENDEVVGLLSIFQDITEDMKIKQDLRSAKNNLEQQVKQRTKELFRAKNEAILARNEAIEASKAKSQFLSSMSHELRTPLNAILGFSQLMQMDHEETHHTASEDINEILKAGNHLLHLINDVLDLAKIEAGGVSFSLEPVKIQTVIEECFTLSSSLAEQHHIRLNELKNTENSFNFACKNPVVYADRLRLKQVLLNLITNAIKYNTENGSVTVSCQFVEQYMIRITVEDTGRGIDRNLQKKLFTAFERLGAENDGIDGTGIGLVISKSLIEEMNGNISFESQPGTGSQFWIELPEVCSETSSIEKITEIPVVSKHTSLKTVLYIEDNPSNLAVMTKIFKHRFPHRQLVTASEPRSGLKIAKEHQPDIILLDINLPIMDGYAVLKQLKQSILTRHIPVIAVTANAMSTDVEKSKGAGFVDYITKPVDINILTKSLESIFPDK